MSGLPALLTAVNELRKIQKGRRKVKTDEAIFIGLATVIRSYKTEEQCEEQHQARIYMYKLHLNCGYIALPFDLIDYALHRLRIQTPEEVALNEWITRSNLMRHHLQNIFDIFANLFGRQLGRNTLNTSIFLLL